MAKVNIKIEGIPYEVEAGMTILEAAKACGYEIPSLCTFNHGECSRGSCRVCLVEATGAQGGSYGIGYYRLPFELFYILSGDAFAPSPGRNYGYCAHSD